MSAGRRSELLAAFLAAGLAAMLAHSPPSAAQQPNPQAPPTPSSTVPAPPPQPVTADVSGFRSARFGMTQEQVREAIRNDFNIDEKDVKQGGNDQEKTKYLAIQLSNLVPDSGMSVVTYIFGYSTQKLIQVNVVWGKLAGQNPRPAELVTTGKLLQKYFLEQGFARDTAIVNRTTDTGSLVLFNGYDDRKRSVLLVLDTMAVPVDRPAPPAPPSAKGKPDAKTPPPKGADGKPGDKKPPEMQLVASALRLSYIENAAAPDVFRIQRGKF